MESDELTENGTSEEEALEKEPSKVRSVWLKNSNWEKLQIVKSELGSWGRFAEVVVEQLLASRFVGLEAREKILKINQAYNIEEIEDNSLKHALEVKEPWSEFANSQLRMVDELVKIRKSLEELNQTAEDHASSVPDTKLVQPETTPEGLPKIDGSPNLTQP